MPGAQGEVKGHIDDAVDKAKDTADDVKDKIVKAVDKAQAACNGLEEEEPHARRRACPGRG